jgi:hypothetical protein
MANKIARTQARLATSVTLRYIQGDIDVSSLGDASKLRALANGGTIIGAVQSFSEANPRTTEPRYELDANKAGDIVERIPQKPDRTLHINRAVLYGSDILQALGYTNAIDIIDQNVPFVIVKVETAPAGSNVTDRTTMYTGCWFHDLPKTYDIGGNLLVMQDLEIGYTAKFTA